MEREEKEAGWERRCGKLSEPTQFGSLVPADWEAKSHWSKVVGRLLLLSNLNNWTFAILVIYDMTLYGWFVLYCTLECFPSSMRGHLCDWNGIKLIAFKLITWAPLICPLFRLLIFIIIDKQLKGGLADYLKTYNWGPSSSIYSYPLLLLHYLWWTIESRWSILLQLNLISIICVLDECWREIPSLL